MGQSDPPVRETWASRMDIVCRSSRSGGWHFNVLVTGTYIGRSPDDLVHSLIEVSGYHSTGHPSFTTHSKFTSNNRSHNMTLPLQDQTTEAARRDSGTTKAVAVDGSASSKYIKW